MGFLGDFFSPSNLKYSLPPGIGSLYGASQGGNKSASTASSAPVYDAEGNKKINKNGFAFWQMPNGQVSPWWLGNSYGQNPGVNTLYDILNNPGQTDSRMFNLGLAANARGTQQGQDSALAGLSSSGFGNSGLGAALQASIGQAGQDRASQMYADEARRREDLKRSDLGLLQDFFVNPRIQAYGAEKGVQVATQNADAQKKGAYIGGAASLIGLIAALAACATAEELYGKDAEETKLARFYMGTMADPETRALYGSGKGLAARVKSDPALREEVKPIFDRFVAEARAVVGA